MENPTYNVKDIPWYIKIVSNLLMNYNKSLFWDLIENQTYTPLGTLEFDIGFLS